MKIKAAIVSSLLIVGPAHAGHPAAACREYAQNAVNQFRTLDAAGCAGKPGDALWSADYNSHYNWCASSNGDLGHEFKRRRLAIESCQNHSESECRKYADNAVNQTREAVRNSCPGIKPPVWQENFQNHYSWCRANPGADLGHQFKIRRIAIENCTRGRTAGAGLSAGVVLSAAGKNALHVSGNGFTPGSTVRISYAWSQTSPNQHSAGSNFFDLRAQGTAISGEVGVSCPAGYSTKFGPITAKELPNGRQVAASGGAQC